MVSLPDELLAQIDEHARRRGTTRSGLLRDLAQRELQHDAAARRSTIQTLLAAAESHGGHGARHVREQRRAR
jgi:metal-responsive CopG/Arc/MetJ family transcriptional regulator